MVIITLRNRTAYCTPKVELVPGRVLGIVGDVKREGDWKESNSGAPSQHRRCNDHQASLENENFISGHFLDSL